MIFTRWYKDRKESQEAVDTAETSLQKAISNRETVKSLVQNLDTKGRENHFSARLGFKLRSHP